MVARYTGLLAKGTPDSVLAFQGKTTGVRRRAAPQGVLVQGQGCHHPYCSLVLSVLASVAGAEQSAISRDRDTPGQRRGHKDQPLVFCQSQSLSGRCPLRNDWCPSGSLPRAAVPKTKTQRHHAKTEGLTKQSSLAPRSFIKATSNAWVASFCIRASLVCDTCGTDSQTKGMAQP